MNAFLQFQAQTEEHFLNQIDHSSFANLCHSHIDFFKTYLLADFNYTQFSNRTRRTKSPLQYHDDLTTYMALYGLAHYERIQAIFDLTQQDNFNEQQLRQATIVDYGCGQGIATLAYLDHLIATQQQIEHLNIVLIEPSALALRRAIYWIEKKAQTAELSIHITAHACNFDELDENYLDQANSGTYIHLFSNVLDMYHQGNFSLHRLTKLMQKNQAEHFIFAVSPNFYSGNVGFDTLNRLLQPTETFLNHTGTVHVQEFHTISQRMRQRAAPVRAYAVKL